MTKPRIIRRVIRFDAKNRPKKARDYRTEITMERVTARSARRCNYHACPFRKAIPIGTEYAKIVAPKHRRPRLIGGRLINDQVDYHFECVPPEARPLVRFLITNRNEEQ